MTALLQSLPALLKRIEELYAPFKNEDWRCGFSTDGRRGHIIADNGDGNFDIAQYEPRDLGEHKLLKKARFEAIVESRTILPLLAEIVRVNEALIQKFGNATTDMFDQMLKGKWQDDHGHDVRANSAMMELKNVVVETMEARARVEELIREASK